MMSWNKVAREVKNVYLEVDLKLKNESKVCSKGCSFCCYQVIRMFPVEEAPISKYVEDQLSSEIKTTIKANLEKWLSFLDDNTPNKQLNEHDINEFSKIAASQKIACPFLINHECSIYKVRPLVCRTHYVKYSPEQCEIDSLRVGEQEGHNQQKHAFQVFSRVGREFSGQESGWRLLPYAIAETFGIRRQFKEVLLRPISLIFK